MTVVTQNLFKTIQLDASDDYRVLFLPTNVKVNQSGVEARPSNSINPTKCLICKFFVDILKMFHHHKYDLIIDIYIAALISTFTV